MGGVGEKAARYIDVKNHLKLLASVTIENI